MHQKAFGGWADPLGELQCAPRPLRVRGTLGGRRIGEERGEGGKRGRRGRKRGKEEWIRRGKGKEKGRGGRMREGEEEKFHPTAIFKSRCLWTIFHCHFSLGLLPTT